MASFLTVLGTWDYYRTRLVPYLREMRRFIYRGQANESWQLSSTLERAMTRWNCSSGHAASAEERGVELVAANAYQYPEVPDLGPESRLEWLAILQHYGCPTRLLDFTTSFYVAAWFAVEATDTASAIWCVDVRAFRNSLASENTRRWLGETPADMMHAINDILHAAYNDRVVVGPVTPSTGNGRLSRQQGVFLVPLSLEADFMTCLGRGLGGIADTRTVSEADLTEDDLDDSVLLKLIVLQDERARVLDDLYHMNIHAASLFGEFDGYARSLSRLLFTAVPEQQRDVKQLLREVRT